MGNSWRQSVNKRSLRLWLVLVYSGTVFLALLLVFWLIYYLITSNLENQLNQNLQERARAAQQYFATNTEFTPQDLETFEKVFGGAAVSTPPKGDYTTPPQVGANFKPNCCDLATSLTYLQVTLSEGQVLRVPDLDIMNQRQTQGELKKRLTGYGFDTFRLTNGERVRVYTAPIIARGHTIGHVQAVRSMEEVGSFTSGLVFLFIGFAALLILVLGPMGWLVVRSGFAPIERIIEAAYRIGLNNDLSERIATDPRSNDEVNRLGRAFNAMLDHLEKNFKAQKQFIADSSHELRTPLTVIRGNLDLLKRNPDPQNQTESLQAIERETERMRRLVEDLLLLAQADAKQSLEMLPLQLDTLVLEVYKNARVLADARHQTLKLEHFDPVMLEGDADRLKRAILNLVDNAIKYTPEEGTISISLFKGKKWARVVVTDNGIGIAAKDQPLIFDRFYRVDKARSRSSGSTGLGLAIVKHIVEAHGGRITLDSEPGKGSTFTIWLYYSPGDEDDFPDDEEFSVPAPEPPAMPLASSLPEQDSRP